VHRGGLNVPAGPAPASQLSSDTCACHPSAKHAAMAPATLQLLYSAVLMWASASATAEHAGSKPNGALTETRDT
jgi:hypothetical protein